MNSEEKIYAWRELVGRVATLGALGEAWMFEGITQETAHHFFYGPFVTSKGTVSLKLYEDSEENAPWLAGEVFWHKGENFYQYYNNLGEETPLPFPPVTNKNLPTKISEVQADLWDDYVARLEIVRKIWLEHVAHWKHQELPPTACWSHGVHFGPGGLSQKRSF